MFVASPLELIPLVMISVAVSRCDLTLTRARLCAGLGGGVSERPWPGQWVGHGVTPRAIGHTAQPNGGAR